MRTWKRRLSLLLSLVLILGLAPGGLAAGGSSGGNWSIRFDASAYGAGELAAEIYDAGEGLDPAVSWTEEAGCLRANKTGAELFGGAGPYYAVVQRTVNGSPLAGLTEAEIDAEFRRWYISQYGAVPELDTPAGWPEETAEEALRWYAEAIADPDFLYWYDEEYGGDLPGPEELAEEAQYMYEDHPEYYPSPEAALVGGVNEFIASVYGEYCGAEEYMEMAQYKRTILENAVAYPEMYPGYTPPEGGESYTAVLVLPLDAAARSGGLTLASDAFAACVPLSVRTPALAGRFDPYTGVYSDANADAYVYLVTGSAAVPAAIDTAPGYGYGYDYGYDDEYPDEDPFGDLGGESGGRLTGLVPSGEFRLAPGTYCVCVSADAGLTESGDALLDWETVTLAAPGGSADLAAGRSLSRVKVAGGSLGTGYALSGLSVDVSVPGIPQAQLSADLFASSTDMYGYEEDPELHDLMLKTGSCGDMAFSLSGARSDAAMDMLSAEWLLPGPVAVNGSRTLTLPALSPSVTEYSVSLVFAAEADGSAAPFSPGEALIGELSIRAGDYRLMSASAVHMEIGTGGDYAYHAAMLVTTAAYEDGGSITPAGGSPLTRFALTAPSVSRRVTARAAMSGDGFPTLDFSASALLAVGAGADVTPPAVPAGLLGSAEGEALRFTWTGNTDPDLAGYRLYRTDSTGSSAVLLASPGKGDTASTVSIDRSAWGDGPWFFSLSALDESGNESARCAPLRMADPALPLEGDGSWSVETGSLRDGVLYLTESGAGSLRLGFAPKAGTDPADLPAKLTAVLTYRDLTGASRDAAGELALSGGSYTGSLSLGRDAARLEQIAFRAGSGLLDTLDLERIPVAAMLTVTLPDPGVYALADDFSGAYVRSMLAGQYPLESASGGFKGYVLRDLYRGASLTLEMGSMPFTLTGSLSSLGTAADALTLGVGAMPDVMRLRVTQDKSWCGVFCYSTFPGDEYAMVTDVPGEDRTDFYIWREDPAVTTVTVKLLPDDDLYELTPLSGGEVLAETGTDFVRGGDYSVSVGLSIRDLEKYMYLDLRCGRDGTGIPAADIKLQLTDAEGQSFLCNWYSALGVLDTSALEAGKQYRVEVDPQLSTAFRADELTITAIRDGSNELAVHPLLTLHELAAVGFSACFLSDDLGVPGSAAGAVPIVPEFDVYYWNKATREWTQLQGVTSYRDGSIRNRDEGIYVSFAAVGLDPNTLDTDAGLKLVFTGKARVCTVSTVGTYGWFIQGESVRLKSGQVFYTVPASGDSGGIVSSDLVSSVTDHGTGEFDEDYMSGGSAGTGHFPAILQWVISSASDVTDGGCVIRGLQLAEEPKLSLRAGRTAPATDLNLLLRDASAGTVYRYPLYMELTSAGSTREFGLPDLPAGSYDLLLYLGDSLEADQLQRQFSAGAAVTVPMTVSGVTRSGVAVTEDDPVIRLDLPAALPEAGIPGIQGLSVLADRDTALTGERVRFTVHLNCAPGGTAAERTLHIAASGDRFQPEGYTCVFTRADGSRISPQQLGDGVYLFPEDGQVIRGSVTVTGLVTEGVNSHAVLEVWEGDRTYGHSQGQCWIQPFLAVIPESIQSGSAAVSGRGGGAGAVLTLRAVSREHPEDLREQTVTVSRYGYWKGMLEYPLCGTGEAETFDVQVLSALGEVLAEGVSAYAGAAEDVLPSMIRITYISNGVSSVVTGYPGEKKDFAALNTAIITFGGDYGMNPVRLEMEFDDSAPDEWGLTDARRVYAPVVSLRANRRAQPTYFQFYPVEDRTFTLNAEEYGLLLEDVPYASAYYAELPDYYLYMGALVGFCYEVSPGREERLAAAPEAEDFITYSRRELNRTDAEIRRISEAFANIETALTAADGPVVGSSSYDGVLEGITLNGIKCGDMAPEALKAGADPEDYVFEPVTDGALPLHWEQTIRLETLDEAAAVSGGEDHFSAGGAGLSYSWTAKDPDSFVKQLRVENTARLIPTAEGVTLRMESTLRAVVDVHLMEGPAAELLSARLQESGAGYYVDLALNTLSDIAGAGVDTLVGEGGAFRAANEAVAKDLDTISDGSGKLLAAAGTIKTAYDEAGKEYSGEAKATIQKYKDQLSRLRAQLSRLCNCNSQEARDASEALDALDREAQAKLDEIALDLDADNIWVREVVVAGNALAATGVPLLSTAAGYIIDSTLNGEKDFENFNTLKSCEQIAMEYEVKYRQAVARCDNSKCEKKDVPLRIGDYITSWDDFPEAHAEVQPKKILDPSGVVYEGMLANPLEGVTCSIEYWDEDAGSWKLWTEAGEFNDQSPTWITGASGYYHWDVPEGKWRVKYHKEGYNEGETLISGEMDVPPVWLDVNQPMTCADPFTASAWLTQSGVSLRFTRPVLAAEVPETVTLYKNGAAVDCAFTPGLEEDGLAQSFTAVLEPDPAAAYEVTVTGLRSYAGTAASFTVPVDASDLADPTRCPVVTADAASGSTLAGGSAVTLSCVLEDAEIWYTTDGSCPCVVSNPARTRYTGPITLAEDTYIIAYAVKEGLTDSPTRAFIYFSAAPRETILGRASADAHSVTAAVWADLRGVTGYCDVVLVCYSGGRYAGMCRENGVNADRQDSVSICKRFVTAADLADVTVKVMVLRSGQWLPLLPAATLLP